MALFQAHYNLLLFDFRAHGESEGRMTSFGWREQGDLEGALAFLGKQPEIPPRPYGVFGISMGGAVALMVSAKDERIGAVVVDSVHANLEESLGHHIRLLYRLPEIPFLFFISSAYRTWFGVWPRHMSPLHTIRHTSPRPVMLIAGDNDPRIPVKQTRRLFEAASKPKELWLVQGAGHLEALSREPETYRSRLTVFFDSNLRS